MRFLGVDFGWEGKPSGLAALECNECELVLLAPPVRRTELAEVLQWIASTAGQDSAMVAIDAPIVIANQAGMREVDRLMHNHYGRYHAGCYPANLGRPFAARTLELERRLTEAGFRHAAAIEPKQAGRYQIEVHPHAATVSLFDLERIIRYKKGRVAERRAGLTAFRSLLLEHLPKLVPAVRSASLPEIPPGGVALKEVEDQLDAILAAYVGAHWWHWGKERNHVYGTRDRGYIVVPHRYRRAQPGVPRVGS